MTKIATIGGLKTRSNYSNLNDNQGKRPDAVMPFFNYLTVTDGEASLQLAKQRLWLYDSIMPEKSHIWAKGKDLIDNALYNKNGLGVHGFTPFLGIQNDELRFVSRAIIDAKKRTAPAADLYLGRQDIRKGLNPDIAIAGIKGENDTVWDNVLEAYKQLNPGCFRMDTAVYAGHPYPTVTNDFTNFDCQTTFELMVKLNTQIPKTSHNGIYAFMPFADANNPLLTPPTTSAKVNDHRKYIAALQNTAKVSNSNLTTWIRNAVMHKNSFNGNSSITPEANIQDLRVNAENPKWSVSNNWNDSEAQAQIGFCVDPISCALLIVIIIVCAKSLGGIIQICKDKEPTSFQGLDDIALRALDFSASGSDFAGLKGGKTDTKTTDKEKCNAKAGYKWNDTTGVCEKIDTGGGGTGSDGATDPPKAPSKNWIDGVPNGVVVAGGAVALGFASGVIKL